MYNRLTVGTCGLRCSQTRWLAHTDTYINIHMFYIQYAHSMRGWPWRVPERGIRWTWGPRRRSVYIQNRSRTCAYGCICACKEQVTYMYIYIYMHMYITSDVHMHICKYIYIRVYVHVHTSDVHMHIHMHVCTCTWHNQWRTYAHTYIYTYMYMYMQNKWRTCTCTYTLHTYAYMHRTREYEYCEICNKLNARHGIENAEMNVRVVLEVYSWVICAWTHTYKYENHLYRSSTEGDNEALLSKRRAS